MPHAAGTPESVGMSRSRLERIGPAMRAYVDRGIYAGVSTLVARKGVIVHEEQIGFADKEAGAPMTADTIFRLYSMTKPVVCAALMTLYEEGRFRLVDPVARYIPAFSDVKVLAEDGSLVKPARPMNVRDLMAHTSGLTYHFLRASKVGEMYADAKMLKADCTLEDGVNDLARFPLAFHPGSRWHYSVGIDVAARVIEVISGQKVGDFLRERVFAPLGMNDTGFGVAPDQRHRIAAMYGRDDLLDPHVSYLGSLGAWRKGQNHRIDVSKTNPPDMPEVFQRGGHGLFGTTRDYVRFAQMLVNGGEFDGVRMLGRKTLELMHANHLPPALLPYDVEGIGLAGYGFGLGSRVAMDVAQIGVAGSVGEFGWSGAAKTHFWVDPREQMVGLFMTQSMTSFDLPEYDLRAIAYQAIVD